LLADHQADGRGPHVVENRCSEHCTKKGSSDSESSVNKWDLATLSPFRLALNVCSFSYLNNIWQVSYRFLRFNQLYYPCNL